MDENFLYPAARGELQEHLGIMGPVIRAEVNNLVTVSNNHLTSMYLEVGREMGSNNK